MTKLKIEDLGIMPYFSCTQVFREGERKRDKVERTEEGKEEERERERERKRENGKRRR